MRTPTSAIVTVQCRADKDAVTRYCGAEADVWSLGICIAVLATGLRPFLRTGTDSVHDIRRRAASERHVNRVVSAVARLGGSRELVALLHRMLRIHPRERCSMREVRATPPCVNAHACMHACVNALPACARSAAPHDETVAR